MLENPKIMTLLARSIVFAMALLIPIALGTGSVTWMNIFSVFSISLLSVLLGRNIACKLGISELAGFSTAFEIVIGFSFLSLLQLLLALAFKLGAIQAFSTAAVTIGILTLVNFKSFFSGKNYHQEFNLRSIAFDAGVLIFISLLTTLWCRELIMSVPVAKATGVLHAWPDIFLHAAQIVSLQNYSVLTNQSLYLAGTEQPLYHVASYAVSSFYAAINNELTLNVATYFLTPAGIILLGVGVYGFGTALAGRLAGFLATAAVFLLPDASMYGFKNGFFGFHWLIQTHPGSGYAIALVLVALALFVRGVNESRFGLALISVAITVLSAAFRVQIAAPAVIMITVLAIIYWQPTKLWKKITVVFSFLILAISVVILFESIELAPHFLTGNYKGSNFFDAVHGMATTSYGVNYISATTNSFKLWKWIYGYLLLLIAALGLIFPMVLVLAIKKLFICKQEFLIGIITLVLLLSCFIVIVFLPVPADGDFTNFGHRQFVLMYAVFLTMLIAWARIAYAQIVWRDGLYKQIGSATVFLLILSGVITPLLYGRSIQQPDLRPDWAHNITATPISKDLFKATSYIREHSSMQDRQLSSNLDPLAVIVSLTERQALLSRGALYQNLKGVLGKTFEIRKMEFDRLRTISSYEGLRVFGAKFNTRWFLKYPDDMPSWPKQILDCAVFEKGGFRVYDLSIVKC